MSFVECPVCGKSSCLPHFNPLSLDNNIYVHRVRGLGRGRGFKVVGRESILGDNAIAKLIAERILVVLSLLVEHGVLSLTSVLSQLNAKAWDDQLEAWLRTQIRELESTLTTVIQDRDAWKVVCENLHPEVEALQASLEEVEKDLKSMERSRDYWKNEHQAYLALVEEKAKEDEEEDEDDDEYVEDWDIIKIVRAIDEVVIDKVWQIDSKEYPFEALEERIYYVLNEYEALI